MKKLVYAVAAVLAVVGATLVAPSTAQAAGRDGRCDAGEFCLYYNSDNQGSVSDFTGSISDYGSSQPSCYEFKGSGAGKGLCVKNEAASVWNRTSGTVTVYYNSNYGGTSQSFGKDAKGNLNSSLKNENASHRFGSAPPTGTTNLSYGLYLASGGRITCGFDGYVNTPGRHEGIDIAKGVGSSVKALVPGQVINIVRGANGSSGLSTIAVYNASLGKTIVYLHSAPLSSLYVGQNVSRGQTIASEAWHGISSSSAAHTHVEMRPGRQTLAAKSVGDYTLSNPDPTSFWNSQGYVER